MGEAVMKITKDTKIGDLIPEGFEINESAYHNEVNKDTGRGIITIGIITKVEEKNFEWHVNNYLNNIEHIPISTKNYYITLFIGHYSGFVNIPREFKWGLFMTICNNLELSFMDELNYYFEYKKFSDIIRYTCPKGFTKSLFK